MENKNRIKLLKISFWVGAILDGIYAINMGLVWLIDSYSGFDPIRLLRLTEGLESRYVWGIACMFMASWTILLIWASKKPIERKDVLMITAFPLVTGLLVDTFFAIATNLIIWSEILLVQLVYISLIVLFSSSYLLTRTINGE
ncbi:MAG: hypothetical protein ACW98I_19860 [Candidatus Hodarchaeales archaeon]